jgi:hypothetical protein
MSDPKQLAFELEQALSSNNASRAAHLLKQIHSEAGSITISLNPSQVISFSPPAMNQSEVNMGFNPAMSFYYQRG